MAHMFSGTGLNSTVFTLDLGEKFITTNVTNMNIMFSGTGNANSNLVLDLTTFTFDNLTTASSYEQMFWNFTPTKKIYVANATQKSWILDKGFTNLSTSNVLIKS